MILINHLPIESYTFGNDDWFQFRDITVRLGLVDGLMDNPSFLTTVALEDGERPDVLAHRLYGNTNLWWTLLMVNNIIDPADWMKSGRVLDAFVNSKYDNPNATAFHVDPEGRQTDQRANRMMVERKPFRTENINPVQTHPISHYQAEENANESRRLVRAIRKEYMNQFLVDCERKVRGHVNNR